MNANYIENYKETPKKAVQCQLLSETISIVFLLLIETFGSGWMDDSIILCFLYYVACKWVLLIQAAHF